MKLEYWHPLVVTRVWEAFEAGAGLPRMFHKFP
jgi:hypothetical protein